jgi:hypothetical protein
MRLKSAALFAVGLLFVSFCVRGGARCQSSPPLSLAPPPSVTDQGSPPSGCYWGGLHLWCSKPASPDVLSPRPTAKGSPPPPTTAAATNSPPPANHKDAPAPTIDNILPTPRIGKLSPSQDPAGNYDGFTVGIDDGEETSQPLPIRSRPAKQSKVRRKPDTTGGPSAIESLDDTEIEKLKPKLTICRGC